MLKQASISEKWFRAHFFGFDDRSICYTSLLLFYECIHSFSFCEFRIRWVNVEQMRWVKCRKSWIMDIHLKKNFNRKFRWNVKLYESCLKLWEKKWISHDKRGYKMHSKTRRIRNSLKNEVERGQEMKNYQIQAWEYTWKSSSFVSFNLSFFFSRFFFFFLSASCNFFKLKWCLSSSLSASSSSNSFCKRNNNFFFLL